nr:PREDICTED: polyamine-modulated factor 1-binding protein 1 [Struthio camelus australis]
MPSLRAELAQAQQGKAKQEEEIAAYEEQRQQLHWELRKLQGAQEQSKQEAHILEKRLQELSSRAQQWQQLHEDSERTLATREEELVVCKVELAFLKEKLSKALEQKEALQHETNMLRQKFAVTSAEAEALRSSLTVAHSDSSRLHRESELVLVNIGQWVKKQKQSNEKLGQKIQQQVKQIAELTGEKEQLQNILGRLQEENKYLRARADEQRRECEQLKASRAPVTAWPETVLGLCSCV